MDMTIRHGFLFYEASREIVCGKLDVALAPRSM